MTVLGNGVLGLSNEAQIFDSSSRFYSLMRACVRVECNRPKEFSESSNMLACRFDGQLFYIACGST